MVPVALDERLQILRHVLLKVLVFPAPRRSVPLVEALVPHDNAHLVAEVQHLRRRTVVARAQRVCAHLLHQRQLAAHRGLVERHSEQAEVRMEVHALELHAASVQVETVRRPVVREASRGDGEYNRADSKPDPFARESLPPTHKRNLGLVQIRSLNVPQRRIFNSQFKAPLRSGCSKMRPSRGRARSPSAPRRPRRGRPTIERDLHLRTGGDISLKLPRHAHRGHFLGHLRRCHEDAVVGKMRRVAQLQHDFTVDARAGIPTRMVVKRRGTHGDDIVLAELHERRRVHAEARVAVVPAAGEMSVHIDLRRCHHAVEVEEHALASIRRVKRQRTTVPAHAPPRQLARATVFLWIERTRYRPVMRHAHALPCGVIKADTLGRERVRRVLRELPAIREDRVTKNLISPFAGRATDRSRRGQARFRRRTNGPQDRPEPMRFSLWHLHENGCRGTNRRHLVLAAYEPPGHRGLEATRDCLRPLAAVAADLHLKRVFLPRAVFRPHAPAVSRDDDVRGVELEEERVVVFPAVGGFRHVADGDHVALLVERDLAALLRELLALRTEPLVVDSKGEVLVLGRAPAGVDGRGDAFRSRTVLRKAIDEQRVVVVARKAVASPSGCFVLSTAVVEHKALVPLPQHEGELVLMPMPHSERPHVERKVRRVGRPVRAHRGESRIRQVARRRLALRRFALASVGDKPQEVAPLREYLRGGGKRRGQRIGEGVVEVRQGEGRRHERERTLRAEAERIEEVLGDLVSEPEGLCAQIQPRRGGIEHLVVVRRQLVVKPVGQDLRLDRLRKHAKRLAADRLRVLDLREVEREEVRARHLHQEPVPARRIRNQVTRLCVCRLDEGEEQLVRKRRRLPERLERDAPRAHQTDTLLNRAPRRAPVVVSALRRDTARLLQPVGELLREGAGVLLVAGARVGPREGGPERHPVELPSPLGIVRALLRRGVEEPVHAVGRERPGDAHDLYLALHDAVDLPEVARRVPREHAGIDLRLRRARTEIRGGRQRVRRRGADYSRRKRNHCKYRRAMSPPACQPAGAVHLRFIQFLHGK